MAYLDFLFGDEEQRKAAMGMSPAGSPSSSPGMSAPAVSGAPAQQNASPQGAGGPNSRGTGFVNFGTMLGLNRGGAEGMAGRLTDSVNAQGQAAQDNITSLANAYQRNGSDAPFQEWAGGRYADASRQANDASARARVLGRGGQGTLIRDVYAGQHTTGGNALDSALSGAVGGNAFRASAGRWGNLSSALGLVPTNPAQTPSGSGGEGGGGGTGPGGGGAMPDDPWGRGRDRLDLIGGDDLRSDRADPYGGLDTGAGGKGGGDAYGFLRWMARGARSP